ncbi:MAG: PASTA domain-containing protein [Oscillospiraceae bacterium]
MAWNLKHHDNFPISVERAILENETLLMERYCILEFHHYSGSELYYHVQDRQTNEHFLIAELLPFQWCSLDYEGNFVPLRKESGIQWEAIRNTMIERLKQLQALSEDEAISRILAIFEEYGTIFYVMPFQRNISLREQLKQGVLSPEDTMQLFTPILDTLAGLHQVGICHGAITDTAIHVEEGECILDDWLSSALHSDVQEDVRAVSLLLYRAMTGETVFHESTAQKLPETIRNALYNGIYDTHLSIMELWHQLHSQKPAKKIQSVKPVWEQSQIIPVMATILFCAGCFYLSTNPFRKWSAKNTHSITSYQKAEQTLPDVSYHVPENTIQLPELLYLPETEAIQDLGHLGLHSIVTQKVENPTVPEGCIVTQSPHAGAILQEGDTVILSVSEGWRSVVPDVAGMNIEKATEKLQKLGFVVEVEKAVSDSIAPDSVISQDVEPESKLERESVIHLLVSVGRKDIDSSQTVTIENYSDMTFEEVKTTLSEQLIYVTLEDRVFSNRVPAGKIVSQSVQAGESVSQGSTVSVVVSLGAKRTSVPDVVSMTTEEAKEAIEDANLRCVLCYVSDDEHEIDTVLEQNYPPETILPIHTEVWLNVSIGSKNVVESLGGWSGNPLPEPEGQPSPETPPEEEIQEMPVEEQ